jgi:hypothetical protein
VDLDIIENLLTGKFEKQHIKSSLKHFSEMTEKFQKGEWESTITKSGKFVEAILKSLHVFTGGQLPSARQFKVDQIINTLQALSNVIDDSIRITIPRATRFVYDIASNRGARHDGNGEIDPNRMDATVALSNCAWILSEMIRFSQKGVINPDEATEIIEDLISKKYPNVEDVDGHTYFHIRNLSAPDVAILYLAHVSPKRIDYDDLLETIIRHGFKKNNAKTAIQRIRRLYDINTEGKIRALATCLQKADEIKESYN